MAAKKHLSVLFSGVDAWNEWRAKNPNIRPDLAGADFTPEYLVKNRIKTPFLRHFHGGVPEAPTDEFVLDLSSLDFSQANLSDVDFSGADCSGASFRNASLVRANLFQARLDGCDLSGANLEKSNLSVASARRANFQKANLRRAELWKTCLSGSDLTEVDFSEARLLYTDLSRATLDRCNIVGAALWDLDLTNAVQSDIVAGAGMRVDHLALAQVLHVISKNRGLLDLVDVLTKKVVLILGRFNEPNKSTLEAIRQALRDRTYHPFIFDIPGPETRNLMETMLTVAHLSKFIVADLTDAKSIPQELHAVVTSLLAVPVVTLIAAGAEPWATFPDLEERPNVLGLVRYADAEYLVSHFDELVTAPAEAKVQEILAKRKGLKHRR